MSVIAEVVSQQHWFLDRTWQRNCSDRKLYLTGSIAMLVAMKLTYPNQEPLNLVPKYSATVSQHRRAGENSTTARTIRT